LNYKIESSSFNLKDIQGDDKEKAILLYYKLEDVMFIRKKQYFMIGHLVFSSEKIEENKINIEVFNTETKEKK